jgi:putative aldouronate transport system substrate-binding protein
MKKSILFVCILAALIAVQGFAGGVQGAAPSGRATTTPVGSYPIQTDVTLTYWLSLHANFSAHYTNMGDSPCGYGLAEKTGVKINYLHPPTGTNAARDQLNLMVADGTDLPDILEYNWLTSYPGGPEKAIDDGVILRLNDIIDQYCPNLKAFLKANPEYDKMVKTDNGSYYAFPFIRGHEKLLYSQGLMIRKDWLDELGLTVPTTIDEWHSTLTAFKTRKNIAAPFTMVFSNNQRMFVESFGLLKNWYVDESGKVRFGQVQPRYRDWITTMAQWYKEGLIDPDIVSVQTAQQNQKMTSGLAGATVASVGSGMGTWTTAARPSNPKYEIMALGPPQRVRGEKNIYAIPNQPYSGQDCAAISGTSKNVEIAARFLDYGYSTVGHNFYNFGTEGVSWTMVNGKPTYTSLILKPQQGWSVAQAMGSYARGNAAGPFVQDVGYIEQYYGEPEQAQALVNYVVPGAINHLLPPITATPEESRELASIMQDINTYTEEMVTKFILGTEVLSDASWNNYINTINRMGIDRAVTIQNAALDRYNKR